MSRRPVPRILRIVNGVALVLFLAGAAVYIRAWFGLRGIESYEAPADAPVFSAMGRFEHFSSLSQVGVWIVVAAVGVAVAAAIAAVVMGRQADD